MISSIEEELLHCDSFSISVAFITLSGLTPLLQTLKELEYRGIPGQILTTDYLNFSDPEALKKLAELQNIRLKMYCTETSREGFHTKGYIFKNEELYRIIVGSSNITLGALTKNREWNTKIISTEQGEYATEIIEEFHDFWESEYAKDYEEFIEHYTTNYNLIKRQRDIAKQENVTSIAQYILQPNKMQVEFVNSVKKLLQDGAHRALLISATGTGKTYASAFALREENPRKALFLVHREQIAKQAIKSYKNVFGTTKKFGLLSGTSKDFEAEYVFSTMQMMAKKEIYERFHKDEFEMIVIDEVHRAGAESYQRILEYFTPKFWLGMTASPERTDSFDIYRLFHHNIAYEIRLQQALEEDLLCPFHYFGITDLEINGDTFDDSLGIQKFADLVSDVRVDYVLQKANYYGYCGNRVKGLVFCSRKEEARELSIKFNGRGYHTEFLCGEDSQERRELYIERLTDDTRADQLDYLFTVDIFNEGVDIPEINQVIMLRPTESPIVFIQQLGRGLRRADDKEYVVILDFIGSYMNNFMIPIALSGDRTYNKDTIRRHVMEGSKILPGSSTIHFDEISKKRIFQSIDKATTTKKMLKDKYFLLKNKLGKIPDMLDFYIYGEVDPMLFVDYARTFHNFVKMVDADYTIRFNEEEEAMLEFISSLLIEGKRPHELLILEMLMKNEILTESEFVTKFQKIGNGYRGEDYYSAINVLNKEFLNTQSEKKRYEMIQFLDREESNKSRLRRTLSFYSKLSENNFQNEFQSMIQYGLRKYMDSYREHEEDNLVLYKKYSRKDICRLLNWEKDNSSTIYGYKIKNSTCPIFVTYEKKDNIASSTKYEDQFLNNKVFSWMTRGRVSINSREAQEFIHYKENKLTIYLFVKKSDGEGTDFYYMGKVIPISWVETTIKNDSGKTLPIMNFQLELQHGVRNDIYDYFTK